jgi:short-subunit dehydrogenase
MPTPYVLITGGSSGIGREMARQWAARGRNVLLVALPNADLDATAQELRQQYPDLACRTFGVDLSQPTAAESILTYLRTEQLPVDTLINNAGISAGGPYEKMTAFQVQVILNTNALATAQLCLGLLPELRRHPVAYILNVSSMGGLTPTPYAALYSASKHFVAGLSQALRQELGRDSNIRLSVLCPGPVLTGAARHQTRTGQHGPVAKLLIKYPAEVAQAAIEGLLAGQAVIIPGRVNWLFVGILRVLPQGTRMRILTRIFSKTHNETRPELSHVIEESRHHRR